MTMEENEKEKEKWIFYEMPFSKDTNGMRDSHYYSDGVLNFSKHEFLILFQWLMKRRNRKHPRKTLHSLTWNPCGWSVGLSWDVSWINTNNFKRKVFIRKKGKMGDEKPLLEQHVNFKTTFHVRFFLSSSRFSVNSFFSIFFCFRENHFSKNFYWNVCVRWETCNFHA